MDDVTRRDAVVAAAGVAGVLAVAGPAPAQKPEGAKGAKEPEAAAGRQEGSEFILKLSGIKLPPEAERRIAAELQTTLLRELARVDLKAGADLRGGFGVRIPNREWLGIWIERIRGVGELPRLRATQQPG